MKAMRTIAVFSVLSAALMACSSRPQRPVRERAAALKLDQVDVPAIRAKPVYTGQMLHWRQMLNLTATGTVSLGPDQVGVSPDGLGELCGEFCPLPEGHKGALIALIREAADTPFECIFEVGADHTSRPECQGRLYLVVNDDTRGGYANNSGSFTVEFETIRPARGNPCRNACLATTGPATDACIDACDDQGYDEVGYCNCAKDCASAGQQAFEDCMDSNCAGVPDDAPADCGQRCSQSIEPTLRACMSSCPPNGAADPCVLPHHSCTMGCTRAYHEAMKACLQNSCNEEGAIQQCLLDCYSAFDDCLESYAPDWCDNWEPDCMPRHDRCSYYCATAYFPCVDHPDCR